MRGGQGTFGAPPQNRGHTNLSTDRVNTTEVCAAFLALSATAAGYDVRLALDASGTFNEAKLAAGLQRLTTAGVVFVDYATAVFEMLSDNADPKAQVIYAALDMSFAVQVSQIHHVASTQHAAPAWEKGIVSEARHTIDDVSTWYQYKDRPCSSAASHPPDTALPPLRPSDARRQRRKAGPRPGRGCIRRGERRGVESREPISARTLEELEELGLPLTAVLHESHTSTA